MEQVEAFKSICTEMIELYTAKNHDYGNSFGKTFEQLGVVSAVTRIYDKFNRLVTLTKNSNKVADESIEDTLIDLASYSIMTLMEIRKEKRND